MGFSERTTQRVRRVPGPRCGVARLRARLDQAERAALDEIGAQAADPDDERTWSELVEIVAGETGEHVGRFKLQHHYRGACACARREAGS